MQTSDATEAGALTIAETLAKLGVDDKRGLTDAEVQTRLKKYGPNGLVEKQKNALADWNAARGSDHVVVAKDRKYSRLAPISGDRRRSCLALFRFAPLSTRESALADVSR